MNATVNNETCAIEFHVIAGNGKPLLGRKSVYRHKYGCLNSLSEQRLGVRPMKLDPELFQLHRNLLTLSIYVLIVSSF
jgi:hypothetical protein